MYDVTGLLLVNLSKGKIKFFLIRSGSITKKTITNIKYCYPKFLLYNCAQLQNCTDS